MSTNFRIPLEARKADMLSILDEIKSKIESGEVEQLFNAVVLTEGGITLDAAGDYRNIEHVIAAWTSFSESPQARFVIEEAERAAKGEEPEECPH